MSHSARSSDAGRRVDNDGPSVDIPGHTESHLPNASMPYDDESGVVAMDLGGKPESLAVVSSSLPGTKLDGPNHGRAEGTF